MYQFSKVYIKILNIILNFLISTFFFFFSYSCSNFQRFLFLSYLFLLIILVRNAMIKIMEESIVLFDSINSIEKLLF